MDLRPSFIAIVIAIADNATDIFEPLDDVDRERIVHRSAIPHVADNASDTLRTLDLSGRPDKLHAAGYKGTRQTTHRVFANNIAVQGNDMSHSDIACFTDQGAHYPGTDHLRVFEHQVLDRSALGIPEHARKVAIRFVYYQILDGVILSVKVSIEHMYAIADRHELLARGIDIGSQFVICDKRVRDIVTNLLELPVCRYFNPVRDSHVARRTPDGIALVYHADSIAIVERISP